MFRENILTKNNEETFGERLIRIRKAKGLTQVELGKIADMSQRMIAHYETRATNPPADKLLLLAKALKVSVDELLGYKSFKGEEIIKNRKLLKQVKMLDKLPPADQKALIHYIEALLTRQHIS